MNELIKANIKCQLDQVSKESAITTVGQMLVDTGYVHKNYINSMLKREKIQGTVLPTGFMLTHGDSYSQKYIYHSGISILQFPNGLQTSEGIVYLLIGLCSLWDHNLSIMKSVTRYAVDKTQIRYLSQLSIEQLYKKLKY